MTTDPVKSRATVPGRRLAGSAATCSKQGIRATFFVMGRHAEPLGDLLAQCVAWGHLLGNHTYSHPGWWRRRSGGTMSRRRSNGPTG